MAYRPRYSSSSTSTYQTPQNGPRCRIWWDTDAQGYQIACPWNPAFLDSLKRLIPASDRDYDDTTKQWFITERFFPPVQKLATSIWPNPGEVSVIDRQTTERTTTAAPAKSQATEMVCKRFMELIPFDAANAAYRKAAMLFHPDREGGDAEKMSSLNMLWERLKKDLYNQ